MKKGEFNSFTARANAKVNLHLGVGEARSDGYHHVSTVFMAVDRPETVRVAPAKYWPIDAADSEHRGSFVAGMKTVCHVEAPDEELDTPSNLAWRAVDHVLTSAGITDLPPLHVDVDKTIPVAGGMAGGSADAAAALKVAAAVAEDAGKPLPDEQVGAIARELGADVPFALMGGVAVGTDRGDALVPMMARGDYWFACLNPKVGLSTAKVFDKLDDLRFTYAAMVPHMDTTLISRALLSGDPHQVGAAMHNDLEAAALALRPSLQQLIHDAEDAGAIRAMISGSGPTVAALCADQASALRVVSQLTASGKVEGFATKGPAGGATLI